MKEKSVVRSTLYKPSWLPNNSDIVNVLELKDYTFYLYFIMLNAFNALSLKLSTY